MNMVIFLIAVLLLFVFCICAGQALSILPSKMELTEAKSDDGPYVIKVSYHDKRWFEITSDDGFVWFTRLDGKFYDTGGVGMYLVGQYKEIKKNL